MTKMCRFYFEIIKLLKGRAELNCHLAKDQIFYEPWAVYRWLKLFL